MTITLIANGDRSNIPEVVGSNPTPATKKIGRHSFNVVPFCFYLKLHL